jgi:hypothetical protein
VGTNRRALRDAGQHCPARGIEITDDLDAEPVLLQRHDGRLQRVLIRQRGETVGDGGVSLLVLLDADRAPGSPGSSLADRVLSKLPASKVSSCHLVLVISASQSVVRPVNHQDLVTIAHLAGHKTARAVGAGRLPARNSRQER